MVVKMLVASFDDGVVALHASARVTTELLGSTSLQCCRGLHLQLQFVSITSGRTLRALFARIRSSAGDFFPAF